ncbi:glyoxalase [Aeromicrobium sp. SMF47]|uniref:VOC family protein n=1 Tax=Aeromicrobium yanjiei TaxID=2662028 RepID=UPI00129DB550|nr:VOC family protein [Aeromicrobium yanjiei]MRJ76567.1 glyoxalase [Aeromicrobium yanjiei]
MTTVHERSESSTTSKDVVPDMKLEVIVLPVSDVDRAKSFYAGLGWREDADLPVSDDFRVVQYTPTGSGTSIIFGRGVTSAAPGSVKGLHLIVSDLESVRAGLIDRGIAVSEIFHDEGGIFHHQDEQGRVSGPDPQHHSYGSFASFEDPDGNGWIFQEITTRLPGRIDPASTTFSTVGDLAGALRRAAAAHGEHEARTGHEDENWPDWYAEFMVREQSGEALPS